MKKITVHWTAGTYEISDFERGFYHFLVGKDGKVVQGKFKPEANTPPLKTGQYAAHCGGGNSWNIGISMAGMTGFKNAKNPGNYPLTQKQFEATCKLAAELCKKYNIPIKPTTVFTHYEFGQANPKTLSYGKIDIVHLPFAPQVKQAEVGNYMRDKINWYLSKLK